MANTDIEVLSADGSRVELQGQLSFTDTLYLPAVVDASALPTADPSVAGQVYSDSGVLTISAG